MSFPARAAEGQDGSTVPCRIVVVDRENGWPVPQVELTTTHQVRFVTDNAGVAAFDLPELMGRETWLSVMAHGYECKADGFGNRGVRLTPQPGKTVTIEVDRTIIAKRLGRLTGGGLLAEAQRCGDHFDWRESGILGCDSVQLAVHRGRLFWAWGDTTMARYPLGIFHMTGATTALRPLENFEPPLKLEYDYLTNEAGQPRAIADLGGPGPTWLSGFISLPNASGTPHLVAHYAKIKPPLSVYRTGLCVWNEKSRQFESSVVLWEKKEGGSSPSGEPTGHPVIWTDETGKRWVLFGDPFPSLKMPHSFEAWRDREQWVRVEAPAEIRSADGEAVKVHRGSIAWNAFRKRWVCLFGQLGGKASHLGEIWYGEARSPFGPWGPVVKVLSHDRYSFYNPRLHPEMTPDGSPVLLFEGTFTRQFSATKDPTPRHDYNQVLYRIDLDDPQLAPARVE